MPPARTKVARERAARAARKEPEKLRTKLLAEADSLKVARTRSTVAALLDRWLPQHEVDPTTRMNYEPQIRNYIKPNLGDVPLLLLVRDASERLERPSTRAAAVRDLCSGKPFIEAHCGGGSHDCAGAGCRQHVCKPYAASSVRQVHAILSGALSAAQVIALQWDGIDLAAGSRPRGRYEARFSHARGARRRNTPIRR